MVRNVISEQQILRALVRSRRRRRFSGIVAVCLSCLLWSPPVSKVFSSWLQRNSHQLTRQSEGAVDDPRGAFFLSFFLGQQQQQQGNSHNKSTEAKPKKWAVRYPRG